MRWWVNNALTSSETKLMEKFMKNNSLTSGLIIPFKGLSSEALRCVIEEFVTRDGTDYGESEVSLDTQVQQVLNQLHAGKVVITFDKKTETCNILPSGDIKL